MFTGIISTTTPIKRSRLVEDGLIVTFERPKGWDDLELGESVATDGVCLTVAELKDDEYESLLMPETLRASAFGDVLPTDVNLERALRAADRMSGHFVQGHVDGMGEVVRIDKAKGYDIYVRFPSESSELVIYKGSITINGASLTVAGLEGDTFKVSLIPHTIATTTLGDLQAGDIVNLEYDMIGKYVARIMEHMHAKS